MLVILNSGHSCILQEFVRAQNVVVGIRNLFLSSHKISVIVLLSYALYFCMTSIYFINQPVYSSVAHVLSHPVCPCMRNLQRCCIMFELTIYISNCDWWLFVTY